MLTTPFTLGVYMVRRFLQDSNGQDMAVDEQRVGRLTGLLAGAFSFAQFTTSLLWGAASNVVGRKPVIVIGTAVSVASMVAYGGAETYGQAVGARVVGGLLNGVLGAWKCIIGESGDSIVQVRHVSTKPVLHQAWLCQQVKRACSHSFILHPTPSAPGSAIAIRMRG
jgi:MFS family permease